jgi:hypothetical protein
MASRNPCTIPRCRNKIDADGLCQAHLLRVRTYGDPLAHIPIGGLRAWTFRQDRAVHGPGFCTCPLSRPAPKCCTRCGYPCVHRMAPAIRDRALTKMPRLRAQIVAGHDERGAA